MKDPLVQAAELLEGMPSPRKERIVKKKKFFSTKHVPLEVAVRRQVAEEIGDGEPTRDEKFVLLQKYGVTAPRIDRLVTKPLWMGEATWKRKQNEWFKVTQGLVKGFQPKRHLGTTSGRFSTKPQQNNPPKGKPFFKKGNQHSRPNRSSNSRPNFAQVPTGNRQS